METRIAKEFGYDLFEVVEWPTTKKFIASYHITALDEMEREAAEEQSNEQYEGMDVPDVGNASMPSVPTTGGGGGGPASQHPAIQQYANKKGGRVVNVQNPGEKMSDERIEEIMRKGREKHGEINPEPRPIDPDYDPVDVIDWGDDEE